MTLDALYAEFGASYSKARNFIKQNSPREARECVKRCMLILQEIYSARTGIKERAETFAHFCDMKRASEVLYENGVTSEVKAIFKICEAKNVSVASTNETVGTTKIGEIIGASQSQDWCADIFEKYKNSVAEIKAVSSGMSSNGTGFVISAKGLLLTNDHVVRDEKNNTFYSKITMTLNSCKTRVPLEVIDSDKKNDVALCMFDVSKSGEVCAIPRIANYSTLKQGSRIVVIGNAFSMGIAPIEGIVRHVHSKEGNLVYTAQSNPGDSGGPVLNTAGYCVGINKSIVVSVTQGSNTLSAQGMTNATPMDKIDELITLWCSKKNISL